MKTKTPQITVLFIALLLFIVGACTPKVKLTLKEKEKEKLIEGHWTNQYNYTDFQFVRGGKANNYKIMWPGSRLDTGTWQIANNGIKLKSDMEGSELYGDVIKLSETELTVHFENKEEYELKRVDDKKKK